MGGKRREPNDSFGLSFSFRIPSADSLRPVTIPAGDKSATLRREIIATRIKAGVSEIGQVMYSLAVSLTLRVLNLSIPHEGCR